YTNDPRATSSQGSFVGLPPRHIAANTSKPFLPARAFPSLRTSLHGVVTDRPSPRHFEWLRQSWSQRCRRFQFSCMFVPFNFRPQAFFPAATATSMLFTRL